jgi:haloalkane dehalogenase
VGICPSCPSSRGPILVAFSDADPIFPYPSAGQAFCDLVPSASTQVRIEGAGHFVQEDRGELLAHEVTKLHASCDERSE